MEKHFLLGAHPFWPPFETLMFMNWFIKKPLICFWTWIVHELFTNWTELMGQLMRQLMGINGENFLEHEMFRNWTNEWKTKTGKTPCAWCKRLWRAFDAVPAGNSRASSGFSACHIIPLSGCIHRKAINKTFSRQEPHLICEFIKCKAAATEPQ